MMEEYSSRNFYCVEDGKVYQGMLPIHAKVKFDSGNIWTVIGRYGQNHFLMKKLSDGQLVKQVFDLSLHKGIMTDAAKIENDATAG